MPRVASLYLPNLATDRIRRIETKPQERRPQPEAGVRVTFLAPPLPDLPPEAGNGTAGSRIEDCSCPRGGGWRPGARWARHEEMQKEVDALPLHQRPPIRELGRRTEPALPPFRRQRLSPSRPSKPALPPHPPLPPLVTVQKIGPRMEIAAASPEAQMLGLHPGMPLAKARMLVQGLDIRDAQQGADAALLTRLALFAVRRWTPKAGIAGPDGLWLDLEGVSHLFGGEEAMCRRILAFCARLGLAARIAVAGSHGAAHALARHGKQAIILCPTGSEADALAPLPLAALRIDEKLLGTARRLGIDRIGELIAMPRGPLRRRFGKNLLPRLDQALDRAAEGLDPIVPEATPSVLLRFLEPIVTAEAIEQAIGDLMAKLVRLLEQSGLAARALSLHCLRVDGEEQTVAIGTARATRDGRHLLALLCARIERIEPGFGIEAMRLIVSRAEPLAPQPVEGELGGNKAAPDLVPLIDRLATRLGRRRMFRWTALESDIPERSLRRVGPLATVACWPPHWPRPVRLLSPPEPVENVMALLPDGAPRRFVWRGQAHVVCRADGPERIHGEWWRRAGEAEKVRDYFQVEDEEGARFWLYRRGDGVVAGSGDLSWHLHGLFA
jgi:protein ImuB